MIWIALSLLVNASSPAMPASTVASGATIAVCFSPEENCAGFAVRAIDNAEHEILVGAYGLTTGSGIVEALVRAKQRGVDVRLIADKTTPCRRASATGALADLGVPIWIDDQPRIAHAKTMVIDGAVTLIGSYNWTAGAARNSEDLNIVPDGRGRLCRPLARASRRLCPARSSRGLVLGVDEPPRTQFRGSARSDRLRRHLCEVLGCRSYLRGRATYTG
jgi:phosphatidylserine/phosphatidylglycerophosphate/cardiolipin synthase-like enzyme